MKRLILSLSLLSVFIIISIVSIIYINNTNSSLQKHLYECSAAAHSEDIEQIRNSYALLEQKWNKSHTVYSILIHRSKTDEFSESLQLLKASIQANDINEFKSTVMICIRKLEQITQSEKITIENILSIRSPVSH